jgi:hypothetical protein
VNTLIFRALICDSPSVHRCDLSTPMIRMGGKAADGR